MQTCCQGGIVCKPDEKRAWHSVLHEFLVNCKGIEEVAESTAQMKRGASHGQAISLRMVRGGTTSNRPGPAGTMLHELP
jgi:hypothetical protein